VSIRVCAMAVIPVPESEIVTELLEEASPTVALPVTPPEPAGANWIVNVAAWPGGRTSPAGTPSALKPAPEIETPETDSDDAPGLAMVTD
jgi:hypothetical protein